MRTFEISWDDLTKEAQQRLLDFYNIKSPSDANLEYNPICIVDLEEETEG